MTCDFLHDLTFAKLLAPMPMAEFVASYWEERPALVRREDPVFYGDLFTLRDFDAAIAGAPAFVKVAEAKAEHLQRIEDLTSSQTQERLLREMHDGATLILDVLNERDPKLGRLCRLLEQELGHRFQTNLYLTPPGGQGFTPHYDKHDVFVLQTVGSKHWRIEKRRRRLPPKDEVVDPRGIVLDDDCERFTLHQGDMVYIPRGYVHAAECGSEPSLHITLGLIPQTWRDLLTVVVKGAVNADESLWRALPLGFLRDGRDAMVERVGAAVRGIADKEFLGRVIDQFSDELVGTFPLDVSGQVAAFFEKPELTELTAVGPRPGIVYRVHVDGDAVRLRFGGRTITFPGFLRTPLDYALRTKTYAVRDVAGDLEDSEKVVFIERLMQEGLVVRL